MRTPAIDSANQVALEAARRAREVFGLREQDSIRDICGLLEDHGVKVLTPAVATDGFFGLSVADEDGGPAVAMYPSGPGYRSVGQRAG